MKYTSASIDVMLPNGTTEPVDLDGMNTSGDLLERIRELAEDPSEDGEPMEDDELLKAVTFFNPEGFAVHLFSAKAKKESSAHTDDVGMVPNFDDLLSEWSDETDNDRREAMGEYLDDMGADDLSDFDEAYQGKHTSGAEFAEQMADDLGAVSEETARWVCIDWDRTWEDNLRHDYHITDGGHVFRHF